MALALSGPGFGPRIERVVTEVARDLGQGRPPEAIALERLATMCDLVVEWNARIDLTAARTPDELVDLLVADAALLAQYAEPGARWVDVGSGAGAPGLPLAILCPELSLTLVEPRAKRVAFLRNALGTLGLVQAKVERKRGEELPAGCWEVAISRATLPAAEWLELGARLASERVWVLLARHEPPALPGWTVAEDIQYRWPLTGVERRALSFARSP
jgi:16S rRNA (guanine527-N7)-methyltransferase